MEENLKQLLLKDLCARLPYGVKIKIRGGNIRTVRAVDAVEGIVHFVEPDTISPFGIHIEGPMDFRQKVKPYLRPMSSMTEEEKNVFHRLVMKFNEYELFYYNLQNRNFYEYLFTYTSELLDWLHAHHFDYRGLIPMGLALEAPEDMYKN